MGTESGWVSGELILSTDDKTVIFKPYQKFAPGETVTVNIANGIRTVDGVALSSHEFSFKITPFVEQPNPYEYFPELVYEYERPDLLTEEGSTRTFAGDMPAMTVNVYDTNVVGDGYIFLAVASETPGIGYYLMILNNDGTPFFARELLDDYSYDFKVQPNGLLSYAQFLEHHSYTGGGNVIHMVMDNSFTIVDSVQMGNGYIAEAHDFQLLPNGHALLFGYYLTRVDMSQIVPGGYPNALVSGGVVQELDANKNVVFQWRTWDYYDFATYPYNPRFVTRPIISTFHLNTINLDHDHHLIIATPQWVKKINRQTGNIIWHLGGGENEYSFVGVDSLDGVDYMGGHMFHRIPNGNYLIYDNGNRQGTSSSLAHEFNLDQVNKVATHVWTYTPDTLIAAWHRGNAQRLPNGNTVIGWGGASGDHIPAITEVNPAGQKVYELSFDDPTVESYRAFRFPFPDGQPSADVTIYEVSSGFTYDFTSGSTNNTGVSVRINSMSASGYNSMTVRKYDYAPLNPEFPGRPPMVKPMRMTLSQSNIVSIDADIMFDINVWGIQQPDSFTVYRRESLGSGLFVPLVTTYNPVTQKIVANSDRFGEYVLTRPDLASIVFAPVPYEPADSSSVNQNLPVTLRWNPVGYVNEYQLQVASDANFNTILIDQQNMTEAFYVMDSVEASTDYYWRVKAFNEAGESGWTATQMFSTIPSYLLLTVPNGGEQWQRGLEYFIQWDDNIAEYVILDLYQNQTFVSNIDTFESSGAYKWEIPFNLPTGNDYYILIESVDQDTLTDMSDNAFTVIDTTTGIAGNIGIPVDVYALHQNYPNPFNPVTRISFNLPKTCEVELAVYDILGQKISTLVRENMSPGSYEFEWKARNLPSGVYLYRLEAGEYIETHKMILMK
jgi:hypothetical protein